MNCVYSQSYAEDQLEILLSEDVIQKRLDKTASELNTHYSENKNSKEPVIFIMVMKGAVCTACDLMRKLNFPLQIEYVKASSYGMGGTKAGTLTLKGLESVDIQGRDVLLVDDIYDTGNTLTGLVQALQEKKPRSLKSLVLLSKKMDRPVDRSIPDYVMFDIDNLFVVGYGLDYKEKYRELPGVFILTPDEG